MFGKEQPDVVTEEEVGEYIEQLKRDGMEDLDLRLNKLVVYGTTHPEMFKEYGENVPSVHPTRSTCGEPPLQSVQGELDELARLSEDSTSGTQVKK